MLPLPDAGPYLPDAKLFAEIALRARRRYRIDDGTFDPSLYGEKVRELIDEHLESLGVDQVLPPVSLTSADFRQKVAAMASPRARASEMEHAIRHHIDVHLAEDPRTVPAAQRAAGTDPRRAQRKLGTAGACSSASCSTR